MKKVITYGTYDLFHEGHYKLLQRAKALGDYLIVGVTTEHFDEARGKLNVVDSLVERIENVRATGFADEIIVEDHEGQKIEDIQKYDVDIFTLGSDWVGKFDYLKPYCEVVYLERTPNISSTALRKSKYPIRRLGIIGTGRMAERIIEEVKYVSGIDLICAYNPHTEGVKRFQQESDLKVYTDDFDAFLEQVDAVYIISPNETHSEYARRAIEAKKHVLSEKPLAFSYAETMELYNLAAIQDVVLMEAIKTAYCPGFQQILNVARSGKIGEIKDVEAAFTRIANPKAREMTDAKYGGAFLEYGGYTLLPVIKLLGKDYDDISIDSILREDGQDLFTKINIKYKDAMATCKMGVAVKSEGNLVISGTKGYILAPSPWWLTKEFEVRYEDENVIEKYKPAFQGDGLRYEISEFVSKINGSSRKDYKLTAGESIAMSKVVELFMEKRKNRVYD